MAKVEGGATASSEAAAEGMGAEAAEMGALEGEGVDEQTAGAEAQGARGVNAVVAVVAAVAVVGASVWGLEEAALGWAAGAGE